MGWESQSAVSTGTGVEQKGDGAPTEIQVINIENGKVSAMLISLISNWVINSSTILCLTFVFVFS